MPAISTRSRASWPRCRTRKGAVRGSTPRNAPSLSIEAWSFSLSAADPGARVDISRRDNGRVRSGPHLSVPRRSMASPSRVPNTIRGFGTRWRRTKHEIRRRLTWSRIYRATSYAQSALWIVPFLSILAVLMSVPIVRWLDAWLEWDLVSLGIEGSRSMYQTVITLNVSFLIFTFGSLLVAIQIAAGQLTPRVIATTLL